MCVISVIVTCVLLAIPIGGVPVKKHIPRGVPCVLYLPGEDIPNDNSTEYGQEKFYSFGVTYVKQWQCPHVMSTCSQRVTDGRLECPVCPNTCVYGGAIYKPGDTFPDVDGVNECDCRPNCEVHCSMDEVFNTEPELFCRCNYIQRKEVTALPC